MVGTSMRSGRISPAVHEPLPAKPDLEELTRLVREHVDDWARVELHTGRTICGWVCDAPGDIVGLYHDPHRPDETTRVPVAEIASIEFTGDTLRWVVSWYL